MSTTDIGDVIHGYQLESVLGRGGMGCVYKATHMRLGRTVALKFLSSELASADEYVSRFLSEAKIVNDVRHPNIVDISDFIELENPKRVAYVMEYIEGPSLGQVLKKQRFTLPQAINATIQLCAALDSVHAVDVVHRDLKPDNVLVLAPLDSDLSEVPSVKILDFGIAKSREGDADHKTATGSILGTPSYMAPEQIAGLPVSPATDIYALGEILFEMLSGRRLFNADAMVTLKTKLVGEMPDVSLPEDVAERERVESLIRRCLQQDAEERPSVAELAGALTEILLSISGVVQRTDLWVNDEASLAVENTAASMNMNSVAMLAPPRRSRSPYVVAAALLVAGAAGIAWQLAPPAPEIRAQKLAERPQALPKPEPARVPPPAPVPPPPPVAAPVPKPAPKVVAKKTRARKKRKAARPRRRKAAPVKAKAEAPPAPKPVRRKSLVKKRDLVPW